MPGRLRRAGGSSSSPTRGGGAAAARGRCAGPPRWAGRGSRPGSRARGRVASASIRSAWSECVASTTSSKRSGSPPRGVTRRRGRSARSIARDRRGEPQPVGQRPRERLHVARASRRATVRHCGRSREPEHPVVGEELDQEARRERPHLARDRPTTPPTPAARSAARRTPASSRARSSHWPSDGPSPPRASSSRASRLKRTRSAIIR